MIKFKDENQMVLFAAIHPALLMIFSDLWWYAYTNHGVEITVTDTISTLKQDMELGRKSSAHRNALAIDFRTKDIDAYILQDIVDYINYKPEYKEYRYLSHSGATRLAYVHNSGSGDHCHLAIHSKYKL